MSARSKLRTIASSSPSGWSSGGAGVLSAGAAGTACSARTSRAPMSIPPAASATKIHRPFTCAPLPRRPSGGDRSAAPACAACAPGAARRPRPSRRPHPGRGRRPLGNARRWRGRGHARSRRPRLVRRNTRRARRRWPTLLPDQQRHRHRVVRRRDQLDRARVDRVHRVPGDLVADVQPALLVLLVRVEHVRLALAANDADPDQRHARRRVDLALDGCRRRGLRIVRRLLPARIEQVLLDDGGHQRGGRLIRTAAALLPPVLAGVVLLGRHGGCGRARRHVDDRETARPCARDLGGQQHHQHGEDGIDDHPAAHYPPWGPPAAPPAGRGSGAPPSSAGAGAASPSPAVVLLASAAFFPPSTKPSTSIDTCSVRCSFCPGTAPRRLISMKGTLNCWPYSIAASSSASGLSSLESVRRTATLRNGSTTSSFITCVLCTVTPFSAAMVFVFSCSAAAPRVPVPPGRSRVFACSRRRRSSSRSALRPGTAAAKRAARSRASSPAAISSTTLCR